MASWRKTYASRHRGAEGGDVEGEDGAPAFKFDGLADGRKQQWRTFISDLEDLDDDDGGGVEPAQDLPAAGEKKQGAEGDEAGAAHDEDDPSISANEMGNFSSHWHNSGLMNSLYMQQLQGRGVFVGSIAPQSNNLHAPAPLVRAELPSTMPLRDWIRSHAGDNQTSLGLGGMAKRIDKAYLEKAVQIALSLANHLEGRYQINSNIIHAEDIDAEKVVVNTDANEAEFVDVRSISSEQDSPQDTQRSAICALGRLYYEMFTQGIEVPSASNADQRSAPAQSDDPTPFDAALTLNNEDDGCEADGHEEQRKQPRRVSDGDNPSHYNALQLAGLPPSLCRLVSDMLENDGTDELFRSDRSIAYLADVVSDLGQMADDPNSFLHDAFIMRLEPIIPEKLYGRAEELRQCLEVANKKSLGVDNCQSMLMISGFSGSGKSRLSHELIKTLELMGWQCLQCKFPQEVRPQPLSTIALAFDRFLRDIVCRSDGRERQEVKNRLAGVLDVGDILVLCQLIPSLQTLVPVSETGPKPTDVSIDGTAAASKCRLHRLFGMLLKALSSKTHPLLVVMDDLQFADVASIELFTSLVEDTAMDQEEVADEPPSSNGGSHVLFVGCYRSDEVSEGGPLDTCIKQLKDCSAVTLVDVHLEGLSSEDVNAIVSDALFYPKRLTRSLAMLIHEKAAGSPLFVKEFLLSLSSDNLLTYSLSQHKWKFDEDIVQMKTVSDGVVDLLTRRLEKLPERVLLGLRILSCLGSEAPLDILHHLTNVCGDIDIIAGLDSAAKELLVKKRANGTYAFAHDMIQRTVYEGIGRQERLNLLKMIANTLIARTAKERSDAELFMIVDLIKRVGLDDTFSDEDRLQYAQLNLLAGEKSIQTPDFASAGVYTESGIAFLGDGCWERHYGLSLSLFKNAAYVHWALGQTDLMKKRINEVLANAKCYEDKLGTMNVLIRSLAMDGKSTEKAYEHTFAVLGYLGEQFPQTLDDECIREELTTTHANLQQLPTTLDQLPIMVDPQKKEAMKFLYIAFYLTYQQKSRYLVPVACRMVQLTMSHGRCASSSIGLAGMAIAFTRRDVDIAYKLGKLSLSVNESPECYSPEATYFVLAFVAIWKEPWQALIPPLLDSHKMAVKCGDITSACLRAVSYVYRSFFSGSSLQSLGAQATSFIRLMARHKRTLFRLYTIPVLHAMARLSGGSDLPAWLEYDDNNLAHALDKKEILLAECIVIMQVIVNFLLRRIDIAESLIRQYHDFFKLHQSEQPLNTIQRTFYTGLVALHCFRQTKDQYWMDIASHALKTTETWVEGCKWSFENKYLLLKAEHLFATGDLDRASEQYRFAISSAHGHRFRQEEALSNELAAYFHAEQGSKGESNKLMHRAAECYRAWGAQKKADVLVQALQR